MTSLIGKTVSHYTIIQDLGGGGMGVVYKAEDTRLKPTVALKFLPPDLTRDPDAKQRFVLEAQAVSALQHPNICTIHDIDETEEGQTFIVLAYYDGESLKEKIQRGPLELPQGLSIGIDVCKGLAAAHDAGVIHRDIKPANVMTTETGEVIIIDFGLARLSGQAQLTKRGTTLGTLAYMSPEQMQGLPHDHRTDIWALGAVLYEMVTGERPFKGTYEQAVLYSILNQDPEPMTHVRSGLPVELDLLVQKAMQKDPENRYRTLHDMLIDLQSVQATLDVQHAGPGEKPPRSIAVLPFVNMSADPENEFFSDGLAEELINSLTTIRGMRVVARTSAFSFKGKEIDIRDIGRKLNVDTVLEGSVRKSGDRLRITAQLVSVTDGYHIWSERYDRDITDISAIQDEISLAIVDKLKIQLLGKEKATIVRRSTQNPEAYSLYLRGRYYWNKRTTEAFRNSIGQFREAIAMDPAFALAYAGLADSYALLGDAGHTAIPPREAFAKARAAVQKAIELDETVAEAHTSLAHLMMHDFDWVGAEQEFKRAIALNPNYATTYHWYAFCLAQRGQSHQAITTMTRALELDPVSLAIITDFGVLYYYARQYDKAIALYSKVLEMDPGFVRAYITLGSTYAQKGEYEKAVASIQKAIHLSGDRSKIAVLGRAYAQAGKTDKALMVIHELDDLSRKRYVSPYNIAIIYASLGETEKAMDLLQ
jgi:serine/threonine-protein kinase